MSTRSFPLTTLLTTLLSLVAIPTVNAQAFNPIPNPVTWYTTTTTLLQTTLVRPNGCLNGAQSLYSSLSAGPQSIAFNYPIAVEWRPECENLLWGTPPAVESAVPATGFTASFDGNGGVPAHPTLIVTLSPPATVFGFEAAVELSNGAGAITAVYKDANGNVLGTVTKSNGPPVNNNYGAQLLAASSDTPIATVEISTQSLTLALGQLRVSQALLQGVEVTQAIQQYQSLSALKTTLAATGGDPIVPIVASKPAVLRAYVTPLPNATSLKVRLTGVTTQSISLTLPPNCQAANQRLNHACPSFDFYFTPPHGAWTAHLDVLDSNNTTIEHHDLNFQSHDAQPVIVRPVSVCDNNLGFGQWQCQEAASLSGGTLSLLKKILPSAAVTRQTTGHAVRLDTSSYAANHNAGDNLWWRDVASDLHKLYTPADAAADSLANRHTLYYGIARSSVFSGTIGGVTYSASHSAAGLASVTRLGKEVNFEVLAHEVSHTMGIKHTNVAVTAPHGQAPGCYNTAVDPTTDWPFADNHIQSAAGPEVGFDLAARSPLDPSSTYEISSYCTPRWISPITYKKLLAQLTTTPTAQPVSAGQFWQVSGIIQNNTATLDPLFQLTTQGSTATGAGTYSILVRDASGNTLFTRQFTPLAAETETSGPDFVTSPTFAELIPVQPGAKTISVLNPSQASLQTITLGGAAPTVTILNPILNFAASGFQTVAWIALKAGSLNLTSRVQYSADNGATWTELGQVNDFFMNVAFDDLPGSNQALIRVLVSDGVNTGVATSTPFKVAKKSPDPAEIVSPANNSYWAATEPVTLSGLAFDPDDGDLAGAALQWTSNRQGALGSGADLTVNLLPGVHRITLTATDSDGNKVTATNTITVADQPPAVTVTAHNSNLVINAVPGSGGAPITAAFYSLDAGATWKTIPLGALPYQVAANGPTDLVAQAVDAAGQWGLAEAKLNQVPLTVTVTPKTAIVQVTKSQKFTANTAVIWNVTPNVGFIDSTGLYTATSAHPVPQTVTVTAYALANTNISGSATMTVTAGPPVFLSAISGDGQTTAVNTKFASPLVVVAIDTAGNPVPGAPVTFTAPPQTGPSVTFATSATVTTDATGTATSPLMTANALPGNVQITVTSGTATPTSFYLTSQ